MGCFHARVEQELKMANACPKMMIVALESAIRDLVIAEGLAQREHRDNSLIFIRAALEAARDAIILCKSAMSKVDTTNIPV